MIYVLIILGIVYVVRRILGKPHPDSAPGEETDESGWGDRGPAGGW